MTFEIRWDVTKEGLEIAFEVDGELHYSGLSFTRIEEMRQEMVRDIWERVPKITEGVGSADVAAFEAGRVHQRDVSAFEAGREHQRDVDDRVFTEPGIYTKLADEMREERVATDEADREPLWDEPF